VKRQDALLYADTCGRSTAPGLTSAERLTDEVTAQTEGQVADPVDRVIQVTPAALVAVEGSTAYVEMSGGCQGCGMARAHWARAYWSP